MLVVNPDSPKYELGRMPCNLRRSFKDLQLGKITTFHFRNIIEETFPQYNLVVESAVPIDGGIEHHMIFSPKFGKHRLAVFNFGRKTINNQVKFYYHNLRIPEYNDLVRSLKIFSNIIIDLEPSFTLEQAYYISTLFIHQPNIKIDHLKYYLKTYKQNVTRTVN